MKMRSFVVWALGTFIVLMSTAVPLLAFTRPMMSIPEDPTLVLVALGGAGVAWQYFRSRVRK